MSTVSPGAPSARHKSPVLAGLLQCLPLVAAVSLITLGLRDPGRLAGDVAALTRPDVFWPGPALLALLGSGLGYLYLEQRRPYLAALIVGGVSLILLLGSSRVARFIVVDLPVYAYGGAMPTYGLGAAGVGYVYQVATVCGVALTLATLALAADAGWRARQLAAPAPRGNSAGRR